MNPTLLAQANRELAKIYNPQIKAAQKERALIDQDLKAGLAATEQAKINAFRDIAISANDAGMLFSGFKPAEEGRYLGETYLPTRLRYKTDAQRSRLNLSQRIAELRGRQTSEAMSLAEKRAAAIQEERARQEQLALEREKLALARSSSSSGGGSSMTNAQFLRAAAQSMFQELASHQDTRYKDQYVSPETYKAKKAKWMAAGLSAADFDAQFGSQFANPSHKWDYGL